MVVEGKQENRKTVKYSLSWWINISEMSAKQKGTEMTWIEDDKHEKLRLKFAVQIGKNWDVAVERQRFSHSTRNAESLKKG